MTTGDVVGTVTDTTGAVVPKVTVTIKLPDTNEIRTGVTSDTGHYRFSLLKPGDYTIQAETTGLKSKLEKFTLLVGQEAAMNLTLAVTGTQEIVEVQGEAAVLETENANLTSGFNTAQVVNLPMNGGDITTIAFTVPGVLVLPGGGAAGNFNVNGIPGASTLFTLNGADDMDPYLNINNSGASNNTLGGNEVAEAAVVLNAFSADYGRMAGAQVNYISKSGTNSMHGNLYYNYNDAIFNANDFFNNASGTPRGRADANQFGGSVSGPIRKNKLFYFFNYETLRYVLPSSGVYAVPSPQLEQYALAHIPAPAVPLYQDAINLWNNAPGINRAVPVTTGSGTLQDSSGNMGCGNYKFPGTAAPGGGVFGQNVSCALAFGTNVSQKNMESLITIKSDYNINDKQKLTFRYNYDWGLQATSASPLNAAFDSQSNQPSDQGQLNYTYVISPTLVNNFTGSGSWYTAIFGVSNFAATTKLMPEQIGISDNSMNSASFASAGGNGGFPTGRNVGQAQLVDDLTWIKGTHTLKVGINYRYNKVTDTSIASSSQRGAYSFADMSDFALGIVNNAGHGGSFSQSFPALYAAHIRLNTLGAYVMDEWKVRPNLSFTLGLRFEHDGDPLCVDKCFARMNDQFGTSGYVGGANVPYNATITTGLPTAYKSLEAAIPEPRFGFAWSPFGSGKTVIRGGIGLFANLFAGSVASSVFSNSPNKFSPSVTFGNVGMPGDAGSSANAALAAYNTFTNGFAQGYTLTQIQGALGKIPFGAPGYYSPPNDFVAPKVTEWSLEVEQPLTKRDVLAVTYTGNHGYDQSVTNSWANSFANFGASGISSIYGASFATLPNAAPDPRFLAISQVQTSGYSNYDAGSIQLRHAMNYGFQGQINFTWAHDAGIVGIYNPNNIGFGYGPLSIDVRKAMAADLIWTQPHKFANKYADYALGGWNIGGKVYVYSGRPFSVTDSKMNSQINSAGGLGTFLATTVAATSGSRVCTYVSGSPGTPCLAASQFETYAASSKVGTPVQMDFGQTGPDSYRGPGYFDLDTQISKQFRVHERMNFEFGAQVYNLLNHANFRNPASGVSSPSSLGVISSDYSPPTSIYGSGQGAAVSGRVLVVMGKFNF
ncbi:MAG: carboxypeptidase regulatory-like domain-containing protein [Candidatus Sulfopaludibacter sp.]|nr:carboxypeptidase regulatory-like domain-containing protein [Candidatus Sulfopaludibacter sp.]